MEFLNGVISGEIRGCKHEMVNRECAKLVTETFGSSEKLVSLDVSYTKITDVGLFSLQGLKNSLADINLSWCKKIDGSGLKHFQSFKRN